MGLLFRRTAARLSPRAADAVVDAIRDAERGHRGEIRVHVEARCKGDALARAAALFEELGMRGTAGDTAVLLYVALASRKVAVFAGEGIHGAGAEGFWDEVAGVVAEGFGKGAPVEGLTGAVARIGELLRTHAPGPDREGNELPDAVTGDAVGPS
ncbi:MAG: TPM domain-containing protein [Myxococcota bacterium]